MKNKTFARKFFYNTIGIVLLGNFFVSGMWFYFSYKDFNHDVKELRQDHIEDQKKVVSNSVKMLVKLIENKKLFEKEDIVKYVSKLRYGKNGYFWINDFTPAVIMHPIIHSFNGQYVGKLKDPNGKFLFNEMVKVCKEKGEGFVEYHWLKPDDGVVKDKISFVKSLSNKKWIIGSGIYLDEVEKDIQLKYDQLYKNLKDFVFIFLILNILLLVVTYHIISKFYVETIDSFNELYRFTRNSFRTKVMLNEEKFKYSEFKILARATNIMVKKRLNFEKKILDLNVNLERKVKDRTLELEEKLIELQKTQAELIQSEKMASLGGLVAGVAHEVNTPLGIALTGITTSMDDLVILEKSYKNQNMSEKSFLTFLDDTKELNKSIETNLHRAAHLIKSFKQVAVDQSSDEKREFHLKNYIEEVLSSLRNKTKKTKHTMSIDIDDDLIINSYPGAYSQIITNMLTNSLTHAFEEGEHGHITISATKVEKNLIFKYQDDGKGLEEKTKKKIFDPFFTTARNKGGSGLGMNIVYNLVTQKLNGSIKVESKKDEGVLFVMKFDLKKEI